uniref:Uncharacterized protein n=1 Tax=Escherichia phage RCF TaxID=3141436 RepID=A0AAU6SH72_9CAUD
MINIKAFFKNIFKLNRLTSVKFYAWMPGSDDLRKTEFKLGLGPCGKVVTKLECYSTSSGMVIFQTTEDNETKSFYYPEGSTCGRIERTYS